MHAFMCTSRGVHQPLDDKQEQLVLGRHALWCSCLHSKAAAFSHAAGGGRTGNGQLGQLIMQTRRGNSQLLEARRDVLVRIIQDAGAKGSELVRLFAGRPLLARY